MDFHDRRFLVLLYCVLLAVQCAVVGPTELALEQYNVVATWVIVNDSIDLFTVVLGKGPGQRDIKQRVFDQLHIGLLCKSFLGCDGGRLRRRGCVATGR